MKRNSTCLFFSSALAAGLIMGGAAPVSADETAPLDERTVLLVAPMSVESYDQAVAETHGFRIVTDENGVQSSVPVTDEAKAATASRVGVSARGFSSVEGSCGTSWIEISRNFTSVTKIKTGYTVRLPTTSRIWNINLYGVAGVMSVPFSSPIGGPNTWQDYTQRSYGSGGFGNVVPGSSVTLVDGAVCMSGSPGTNF